MNIQEPGSIEPKPIGPPSQVPVTPKPIDTSTEKMDLGSAILGSGGTTISGDPLTQKTADQLTGGLPTYQQIVPGRFTNNEEELAAWASQDTPLGEALDEREPDLSDTARIRIPESNPFFNRDVIIFKDDYEADLPYLNAMRESEWKAASQLIEQLRSAVPKRDTADGPEYIKVESLKIVGNESFRAGIVDAILVLCTRSASRELIRLMSKMSETVHIVEEYSFNRSMTALEEGVWINPFAEGECNVEMGNGKTERLSYFYELILAHELIHVLHERQPGGVPVQFRKSDDPVWSNIEERRTISGWTEFPIEEATLLAELEIPAEGEVWDFDVPESHWNLISENGIRMLFNLRPRADHGGKLSIKSSAPKDIIELFEGGRNQRCLEIAIECAESGDLSDALSLIKSNLAFFRGNPETIDYIILKSFRFDNIDIAKELIKEFGYHSDCTEHLIQAFENGKVDWLELWAELPEAKLTTEQSSKIMNSLRSRMSDGTSRPQDKEMLRILLDKGVLDVDAPLGDGVAQHLRGHTLYGSLMISNFGRDFDPEIASLISSRTTLNAVDWYIMICIRSNEADKMNLFELLSHPAPKIPEGMEYVTAIRNYQREKAAAGEVPKPLMNGIRIIEREGRPVAQMAASLLQATKVFLANR